MDSDVQGVSFQLGYLQSVPGILKIIELLCDLLGTILAGAGPVEGVSGHRGFFLFVSIVSLLVTFALLIVALFNIKKALLRERVPGFYAISPLIGLGWCAIVALFYFIASIVIATAAKYYGVYGGAAFFGFAAFITYLVDAIFHFRTHRNATLNEQATQQYSANTRAPAYVPYPNDSATRTQGNVPYPSDFATRPQSSASYPNDPVTQPQGYPSYPSDSGTRPPPTY